MFRPVTRSKGGRGSRRSVDARALTLVALLLLATHLPARAGITVRVEGLGSDERTNVEARLSIRREAAREDLDASQVQRLHQQAEGEILTAMQPYGWYNVKVQSTLEGAAPDWTATYRVDAGPETDIAHVDIAIEGEGRDDAVLQGTAKRPRLPVGERLKHEDYEAAKDRLLKAAYGEGYLDASFSRHELRVDVDANRADIALTLDTGPRYFFGAVAIQQDGRLKDELLRRYVTLVPGAPFDPQKVFGTQFALSDLDYFSGVEMETHKEQTGADHAVPVTIKLTSKPPRDYKLGVGYGTDTGARALFGLDIRRIDQDGDKLRFELRPSERESTGLIEYKLPRGTTPGENLSFTLLGLSQTLIDGQEDLWSLGTAYTRLYGTWQRKLYLVYLDDRYKFDGEDGQRSRLLMPGVAFTHADLDDPVFPRLGWSIFLDSHGATRPLLSNADFIQAHVQLRGIVPVGRRLRLLGRVEEGATLVSDFGELPPSQRFFAGGDESVRGYAYESLGPHDANGKVIGGRYLTTGSLELDWEVKRPYGVAVFTDAGGADNAARVPLHVGAGIGLRYRAPFGSVGVDLAHPFDTDQSPVRLHLSVRVGL